jgi:hypothetical protein
MQPIVTDKLIWNELGFVTFSGESPSVEVYDPCVDYRSWFVDACWARKLGTYNILPFVLRFPQGYADSLPEEATTQGSRNYLAIEPNSFKIACKGLKLNMWVWNEWHCKGDIKSFEKEICAVQNNSSEQVALYEVHYVHPRAVFCSCKSTNGNLIGFLSIK